MVRIAGIEHFVHAVTDCLFCAATRSQIEDVCQQIASLDYLGLDIIITEDGMKICEINSHPGIDEDQILDHPIFYQDENAVKFFDYHGLFKVNNEDFYDMYMKSQVENT